MSVIHLAEVLNDNKLSSPEQLLRRVADEIADPRPGEPRPNRAIVILISDEENGPFHAQFRMANCNCARAIAAVEFFKADMLDFMRGKP